MNELIASITSENESKKPEKEKNKLGLMGDDIFPESGECN